MLRPLCFYAASFLVQILFYIVLLNYDEVEGVTARKRLYDNSDSRLLLVSFDGFRWDYLNRDKTPTFNSFASSGGKAKYTVNAFVTKTFPNHYTLVTGLYEESHGIIGNSMYDPVMNTTFSLGNLDPKWWSQDGQEPIWITNQKHGGSSGVIEYPGMDVPFNGMLPNYELSHYDEQLAFNNRSDSVVELFANGSINFAAVYFHEPDHTGHLSGPESTAMDKTLEMCDDAMLYLIKKFKEANIYENINIIVTSDHGMTETSYSKTVFAEDYLDRDKFPYFTTANNPVLGIWPKNSADVDALYRSMKAAMHITVYKKEDIPHEYRYTNNIRVPPIIAVGDEGWMVVAARGSGSFNWLKGDHGYSNSLDSMHPFFMVHGPAFKSGAECPPFRSVDVYPLMCEILGIPPRPNNGTMTTVKQLLKGDGQLLLEQQNDFFSIGIAFACIIAMLSVVLIVGMCLRQRTYRTTERTYHPLDTDVTSQDNMFENRNEVMPNTNI